MNLQELLANIIDVPSAHNCEVLGLAIDSRKIQKGYVFFACPGYQQDGRNYISQAVARGAVAIVYETKNYNNQNLPKIDLPLFEVENLSDKLGAIAARFYQKPSEKLQVIGITGTNGKTSCSHFIAKALQQNDIPCGIIGTLGLGMPDQLQDCVNTTPDAITLQKALADLYNQNAKAVAMEVSSHALVQGRVNAINFTTAVFTNLTHDHLDFHGNIQDYAESKKQLFLRPELKQAIINFDDEFGKTLLNDLSSKLSVVGYSVNAIHSRNNFPMITIKKLRHTGKGFTGILDSPWGSGVLTSDLFGQFNVSNLLAVLGVLLVMGIPFDRALDSLSKLPMVVGRMQTFGGGAHKPLVVVDYAHTPDALEKVLKMLREHCIGKLWCIFGCGGGRDRTKRPIMGKIAELYADRLILTDDNPRYEDPNQIIEDIKGGLLCPWAIEIERERGVAIDYAINNAQPGDVILLAGKGHESYQIIGDQKILFSDIEQAERSLNQ